MSAPEKTTQRNAQHDIVEGIHAVSNVKTAAKPGNNASKPSPKSKPPSEFDLDHIEGLHADALERIGHAIVLLVEMESDGDYFDQGKVLDAIRALGNARQDLHQFEYEARRAIAISKRKAERS